MKKEKKFLLFLALVLIGALLFSSVPASASANPGRGKSLVEARKTLEKELLPLAGAGFVGITHSEADGEITVFVENEQAKQRVPRSFEGYAVRTEITGKIQAFSTQVAEPLTGVSADRLGEVRPLVGGTSLSAYVTQRARMYLYAGTLGMVTYDNKILSAAHVIAMNPDTYEFLTTGTPILQPGTLDGGRLSERVGALQAYMPINFTYGAKNYADAAIGSIDGSVSASPGEQFSEGGNYGIEGWIDVSIGDTVQKSGRTTGVTTSQVTDNDASFVVSYGNQSAYFVDQIVITQVNSSFAQAGDSGSVVSKDGKFVGLLFAGSANCAVICKAKYIIDGLGIAVVPPGYSLTISSTPGGNVTQPGVGTFVYYNKSTVVNLTAVPDTSNHYHFAGWTGNATSAIGNITAASTTITMNDSYSIIANFALDPGYYSLTISSTPGGNVTTPGVGTFVYGNSTVVNLTAVPDTSNHYHFVEWTGNATSAIDNITAASTNITMNDSYSITANFALDPGYYSLTISSTLGGTVTQPGVGTFVYGNGTVVSLVAEPDPGYQFVKWTGNATSAIDNITAASTNITMNDSYSIMANFEWPVVLLTISSTGGGSVLTPGEGTFSCPFGANVSLVAVPDEGYQFVKWTGNVSTIADVSAASTTIAMNGSYDIIASFNGTGGTSSRCFIATAAYGTPMAKEIQILREFRDEYLLTNVVGRTLVDIYYRVSPPIAEFITAHPNLKPIVRAGLSPALAMSTIAIHTSPAEKITIIGLLALVSVAVAIWATRRRGRDPQHT
jgi:hypothetical protein